MVGIPHEYSGEAPLAFVVLSHAAQARVKANPAEAKAIKAALIKACIVLPAL